MSSSDNEIKAKCLILGLAYSRRTQKRIMYAA